MKIQMLNNINYKRLIKSIAILIVLFLIIFVFVRLNFIKDFIDLITSTKQTSSFFSESLSNDIFDVNNIQAKDFRFSKDNKVIGFSVAGNYKDTFLTIKVLLEQNNWKFFESQRDNCASFYKSDGQYTWLFLNCVQMGEDTSVVVTAN